jgi:cysteine desulfuration protein SufE
MSLPEKLSAIVEDFRSAPPELRIDFLIEYAEKLPPLPEELRGSDELERVVECQTPFFLATHVTDRDTVELFFEAPPESPTTRAFAGILYEGLWGLPVDEVLEVPDGFYNDMGLAESISALRLRGMAAIMGRMKRQLRQARAGVS